MPPRARGRLYRPNQARRSTPARWLMVRTAASMRRAMMPSSTRDHDPGARIDDRGVRRAICQPRRCSSAVSRRSPHAPVRRRMRWKPRRRSSRPAPRWPTRSSPPPWHAELMNQKYTPLAPTRPPQPTRRATAGKAEDEQPVRRDRRSSSICQHGNAKPAVGVRRKPLWWIHYRIRLKTYHYDPDRLVPGGSRAACRQRRPGGHPCRAR